ncbi:uncharacterized protein K460DRAFT_178797 [Cucurbitaria berberidis CBS 394.84]|uniref:BTB domain-containing protein n=1 Tax=Cucurbitaria berberidis CBS 394.84 TaxID=1168544 RepID=A0A9P4GBB0_9PLEO|nr:uncharacterized protein K460DRAFT_178797 [Cucurbitaria berberidis CBS 394.84]KAF1842095.1 hypothetical protein K460DRAFT_178797 [Cucurbitaria berberidis CBS 394.84]
MSRRDPKHLKILRGASIEISVGLSSCLCSRPESCDCNESWFLPKALISQYSPFLRAACTRDFKERDQNLIELPEDDPAAFALFVEWMYYGEYTVLASSSTLSESLHNDTNMNAKCWVLGDKLLCTEFKNYAMGRLYMQHTARSTGRVVATYNVQYVCEHSATTSKLRQFYLDYVVEHFADPTRLKGTTEEWDELLIHHKDLRMLVFQSFKTAPDQRRFVQSEMNYMDQDELLSNTLDRLRIEGNDS